MDSARLSHSMANIYIPPMATEKILAVPNYHPCLIVQDSQTDVNKVKPCGCADSYCVKKAPEWIPRSH